MSDRLQEIRARLDASCFGGEWTRFAEVYRAVHLWDTFLPTRLAALYGHAPADIAWLLAEVERLTEQRAAGEPA